MRQSVYLLEAPRGPSQLVETDVPANGTARVPFNNNEQLKNKVDYRVIIKGMRLVTAEVLTNSMTSGNVTAPVAELQKMAFVFYAEGWQKAVNIPALFFNDMTAQAGVIPHRYQGMHFDNWVNVDWGKSYIQYANGTSSAGAPYTVMLDVLYERVDMQGRILPGPI